MKGAKRYKMQRKAISLVAGIVVFGLVILLRSKLRAEKIVTPWYQFVLIICIGGIIVWLLGELKDKRRLEKARQRKAAQTVSPAMTNSPRGIKACPYCGADMGKK
jgi:hypothetical protein